MKKLTGNQVRELWLDFFKKHDHYEIASASLIPINDNSLLWINSGVATLKDFFSGKKNPPHKNLTNSQKCIRTNDIFNVGITSRHHTFFEMLGNFSIGGYFKEQAIEMGYDLLINKFEIDINKLYFTVFEEDDIAYQKWLDLKINPKHIIKCNRDRNFWDVGMGPCGPCTEIYYDRGPKYDPNGIGEKLFLEDIENDRYVEIWNIVFSEFNNDGNNNYTQLERKNIDTGAGLERITCISQDVPTNFDTDLFQDIIKQVEVYSKYKYDMNAYFSNDPKQNKINLAYKVIADHARASVFAIADGAIPSNKERGYILRRLIRRLIVLQNGLDIKENIFENIVKSVVKLMKVYYPYLVELQDKIISVLNKEYEIFKNTLDQGFKLYKEASSVKVLDGNVIFKLVETYGFPIELIKELAQADEVELKLLEFDELFKEHQRISNAKRDAIAMQAQNGELLNLVTPFKFYYDKNDIEAKIVKLYNDEFVSVDVLNGSGYVVFDQSCVYATSGGQMCDYGDVDGSMHINDVIKGPNLQHIHHVENALDLKLGSIHILSYNEHRRHLLMKNHSVEHLIHAALTVIVDKNIKQEGAHKSPEKVSFDFQYHEKLDEAKLAEIEKYINNIIKKSVRVDVLELSLEEAQALGAKAYFEDVYKKIKGKLRVVKMGDESTELCGGTHVNNTDEIQAFKIINFFSRAAGSWRIEAITSHETINKYLTNLQSNIVENISKINESKISDSTLDNFIKSFDIEKLDFKYLKDFSEKLNTIYKDVKFNFDRNNNKNQTLEVKQKFADSIVNKLSIQTFNNFENKNIFNGLNELINEYKDVIFIAFNQVDNKIQYLLATNENNKDINLNVSIKVLNELTKGKGGGKPSFVQGGCVDFMDLNKLVDTIKNTLSKYA